MISKQWIAATAAFAIGTSAVAGYTVTQSSAATTYGGFSLTFDEPGTPTGVVSASTWQSSHGVIIDAGDGVPQVDDFDTIVGGWGLGDGNSYFGNFGVFMTFDYDVAEMAFELWDSSGPPSPFGGGVGIFLFNDGAEVAAFFGITPAFGGVGDSWFNVTTDGGMVFDEIRMLGFGSVPQTFVDNLSWNAVPTPGAAGLVGLAAIAAGRRRR